MITHWDDLEGIRREQGHIAGTWYPLTGDASVTAGVRRVVVDPGRWSTPLHVEGSEEEIFYVLAGSGLSVQSDGERIEAFEVGRGDCLVHLALEHAHTLRAGPDGLDVLAFGQRHYAGGVTVLPRAGAAWLGASWGLVGGEDNHPWRREAAIGPPDLSDPSPRPDRIVNVGDVEAVPNERTTVGRTVRDLGRAAGSRRTGLRLSEVTPGKLNAPPHCHSAEEEIFVVLAGDGDLLLWPEGAREPEDVVPVRAGTTVARPAGTGVAHAFRAGAGGLTVLMYGTRDPGDLCYYPRSQKVYFGGLGVVTRLEQLDFWEGED
ncbi:MAG TPA: hypothetical protein VFR43_04240 [Gaiellaceae bacterium]|nr:hypothetical protein [Gaiellaceae bacterium]